MKVIEREREVQARHDGEDGERAGRRRARSPARSAVNTGATWSRLVDLPRHRAAGAPAEEVERQSQHVAERAQDVAALEIGSRAGSRGCPRASGTTPRAAA